MYLCLSYILATCLNKHARKKLKWIWMFYLLITYTYNLNEADPYIANAATSNLSIL